MGRLYKKIKTQSFCKGEYALIPIRDKDKYEILKWRNEQIDILRQDKPLTVEQQENYFAKVIDPLFEEEQPGQFIFSFLQNNKLIGYGGLVHIDWDKETAEISFLTETSRNSDKEVFISDWSIYLRLIKQVADMFLNFRSIFTYAYDIRPVLYLALESCGLTETDRIKDQIEIKGDVKDVVIHTLTLKHLDMRLAGENDIELYFTWANDPEVRKFSFQQELIKYEDHVKWFTAKIHDPLFRFYIFCNTANEPVGQVRINKTSEEVIIGISIDANHRGLGYGSKMVLMACNDYFKTENTEQITAYIKNENSASVALFKRAGFIEVNSQNAAHTNSLKLILRNEEF